MFFRIIPILLTIILFTNYYSQEITFSHLNGPYGGVVGDIAIDSNDNIYAGVYEYWYTHSGLYKSTDNGDSWIKLNTPDNRIEVYAIFIDDQGTIFVGTDHGGRIWRSTDEGETWLNLKEGYNTGECWAFGKSKDGIMFAGNGERGNTYKSTNYGETWEYSATLRPLVFATNSENTVYCGSFWGLFATQDNGDNWAQSNFLNDRPVSTILIDEFDGIYCGTGYYNNGNGVYYSPDKGLTWNHLGLEGKVVLSLAMDSKGNLYAGTLYDGVFIKEEGSNTWQQYTDGLYRKQVFRMKLNSKDDIFIGSENEGVYRSINGGESFEQIGLPVSHVENIVFDKSGKIYAATPSGVQKYDPAENKWQNLGLHNVEAIDISPDEQLYAATFAEGVYRSTNLGLSWQQTNITKDTLFSVYNIKVLDDGTILAATEKKLRRSTDNGKTWEVLNLITSFFANVIYLDFQKKLYVSAFNDNAKAHYFYKSEDIGKSFSPLINCTGLINQNSIAVDKSGIIWFANNYNDPTFSSGLYLSRIPYSFWEKNSDKTSRAVAIDKNDNIYFGSNDGIYTSYDLGNSWHLSLSELSGITYITQITFDENGYIFVGTDSQGIFKSDLPTIIENKNESNIPNEFELFQNYPNPFNPTTTIKYVIPRSTEYYSVLRVQLKIIDILGREITTLVDESKQPGTYEVEFNAVDLPSGVYFYRLSIGSFGHAGDFTSAKKMILIR